MTKKIFFQKELVVIFFLIATLLITTNKAFADDSANVKKFINDLGNTIIKIADNKKLTIAQRREKLVNLIDGVIDANWVSKFVLGKYYRTATPDQKQKFKELYRQFMINTYSPKFSGYNGEKFEVTSVANEENYYTAKCLFYPKDNAPAVNLDFRVKRNSDNSANKNSQFLIFDIVAEGVSLIETQRSEFGSAISNDGLDKFLADLAERVKQLKSGVDKPSPVKGGNVRD